MDNSRRRKLRSELETTAATACGYEPESQPTQHKELEIERWNYEK